MQRDFIPIVTSGHSKTGDSFLWLQPRRLPLVGWLGGLLSLDLSSSRVNGQWCEAGLADQSTKVAGGDQTQCHHGGPHQCQEGRPRHRLEGGRDL